MAWVQVDKYHRIVLEVSMLEVETALTNRQGIEFAECNTVLWSGLL